jgi:hypothetical protein
LLSRATVASSSARRPRHRCARTRVFTVLNARPRRASSSDASTAPALHWFAPFSKPRIHEQDSIAALVAVVVAGCSSTPRQPRRRTSRRRSPRPARLPGASTSGTTTPRVRHVVRAQSARDPNILSKRSVISSSTAHDRRPIQADHPGARRASAANCTARVTPQAADERGSREYNIALGQKRATR